MLLITRLVPVFPFNLQNYAYGITGIGLLTYVLLTRDLHNPRSGPCTPSREAHSRAPRRT